MKIELVLLDRDGVINFDSPDYIKAPGEWHPLPGAPEAIVALQAHVRVAVCTNQSGVGRGFFSEQTLSEIHDKLNAGLLALGGQAVDVYYCPHHPDDGCSCRKPQPELLLRAMQAFAIEPANTLYAGDSEKDLLAAAHARCQAALVMTGNGRATAQTERAQQADLTCESLAELPAALGFNKQH